MTFVPLVLAYLLWETALTAACLAALAPVRARALKLALLIGLNISVSALCASALCFLRLNSPAAYAVIAVALAAGAALSFARRRAPQKCAPYPFDLMALAFALGLLLVLSIRPIEEVDSLYNLHYVMGWVQNKTTPYEFAFNYVPFWELSFVPGLVLTHSDLFLWCNSLKPVLLLGVVLFLIAREMELPERFALWTASSLLLFPSLWLGPSGVSTIKNDMIHAAGFALAALAAVRAAKGKAGPADVALAALAAAFVSVKFSGPAVLAAGSAVLVLASARWILANRRKAALAFTAAGGFWFITAGQYYLRNYLAFGNPVYPYEINLGPLRLPGLADLSGTSILWSLGDARLWRYFFLPEGGISPAGFLFPAVLAAILLGSAAVALLALKRRRIDALAALALFQLLSWFIYFRSNYSASAAPGDLRFIINGLNSVRYAEGALLVGELCVVWALWKLGVPRVLICILLAAEAASRFTTLLRAAPDRPWALGAAFGLALALFGLAMRRRIFVGQAVSPAGLSRLSALWQAKPPAPQVWPLAAAVLLAGSLVFGAHLLERRRPLWLPELQSLYLPLYDAPAERVFYLIDDEYSQQHCRHLPFLGRRLQHDADSGKLAQLTARQPMPRFVVWTPAASAASLAVLPGYSVRVRTAAGVLLERR